MNYLVLSDSHGNKNALFDAVYLHPTYDIVFLGDGSRDINELSATVPVSVYTVRGNCDFETMNTELSIELHSCKHKLFAVHGHMYGVKYTLSTLLNAAISRKSDAVLFGHTHIPMNTVSDGVLLFNPGSIGYNKTYGILTVTDESIKGNILSL